MALCSQYIVLYVICLHFNYSVSLNWMTQIIASP